MTTSDEPLTPETVAHTISQTCEDRRVSLYVAAHDVLRALWPRLTARAASPPAPAVDVEALAKALDEGQKAWFQAPKQETRTRAEFFADVIRQHLPPAPDTIPCRVVRRPVDEVRTLKTPGECGIEANTFVWYEAEGDAKGAVFAHFIDKENAGIIRWSADGETWHRRTVTETPRPWQAGDVPEGEIAAQTHDGRWWLNPAGLSRAALADEFNRTNVVQVVVLPGGAA